MASWTYLLYEKTDNVGILKFHNPRTMNALNSDFLREIRAFLDEAEQDAELRVLIVTGEGKAFIAGGDIREMNAKTPHEAREFSRLGNEVMRRIETFRLPVIAAVNGYALGGGLELALSADFVYAASSAKFGLPELTLGLIPGFGGCKRLSDRIGIQLAKELVYTGRMIIAEDALRYRIVNRVVAPEELMPAVLNVAKEIIAVSPQAIRESKELLMLGKDGTPEETLEIEINKFGLMFAHPDSKIGTTAFLEKRTPVWKDGK